MRHLPLLVAVCLLVGLASAGEAAAAACPPPAFEENTQVEELPAFVRTGTSTFTLKIDSPYTVTAVSASVPAPGSVSSVTYSNKRATITATLPATGSVPLTLFWTKSDQFAFPTPCTESATVPLRVVAPASSGPRVIGRAFSGTDNGVSAGLVLTGCRNPVVVPLTIVVRARVGSLRPAVAPFRPRSVPAPTAASPKLTIAAPRPCTGVPVGSLRLPGATVRFGLEINGLALRVTRRFRGSGTYSVHLIVEFRQPGLRTVRFRVTGYFYLADFGKGSQSVVRRI